MVNCVTVSYYIPFPAIHDNFRKLTFLAYTLWKAYIVNNMDQDQTR